MKTAPVIFALLWTLAGCGPALGECDAAAQMGYQQDLDLNGVHTGQNVVQSNCAGGVCHSATAVGAARVGAPAGLNFDTFYLTGDVAAQAIAEAGGENARDWAEDMWAEIDADRMPPNKPLDAQQRAAARNWLACGAQVLPQPMVAPMPGANGLESAIQVLGATCVGCHNPTAAPSFNTPFIMGTNATAPDVCETYQYLTTSVSGCAPGRPMIVSGQPDQSLLLGKLNGSDLCGGGLMPLGATMPFSMTNATTYEQLRSWVADGAPKPTACP